MGETLESIGEFVPRVNGPPTRDNRYVFDL
jgi:hypothetical protein